MVFLKISRNLHENTCARASLLIKLHAGLQLYLKEILAQVFSCKFCEIFKRIFFYRTPPASDFFASDFFPAFFSKVTGLLF